MSCYRPAIHIPDSLDKIIVAPLLLLRRIWYGYTFRRITLVNSKRHAIVDPADYYPLSKHIWLAYNRNGSYTILRFSDRKACFAPFTMHRAVMQIKLESQNQTLPPDLVIDHINNNPHDNRRSNLRMATIAQNNKNKRSSGGVSKYKGVVYRAHKKLWIARITVNGKRKYIKSCKSEIDAAKAYDLAAKKYYGEFAYLNFPVEVKPKGLKQRIEHLGRKLFIKQPGIDSRGGSSAAVDCADDQ
ncbi:MAG: HNH endonuclease [Phycisphaerae bacterium]|jgi:hypothetical protein